METTNGRIGFEFISEKPFYWSGSYQVDRGSWLTGEGVSMEIKRDGPGFLYRKWKWGTKKGRWLKSATWPDLPA